MLIANRSLMLSKSLQIPICSQTHSICSHVYLGRMLAKEGNNFLKQNFLDFDSKHDRKQTDNLHGFSSREIPQNNSHSMGSGEWLRGSLRKRCLEVIRESQAQKINSSTFLSNGTRRGIDPHRKLCPEGWNTGNVCWAPGKTAIPTGRSEPRLQRGPTAP